jgi:hypothetical protein
MSPYLYNRQLSRAELLRRVGHLSQVGGVQVSESTSGPSRGVRNATVRTGSGFSFTVAVERGMDVTHCEYWGMPLGWIPPTLLAGPWLFEQQSDFGWLRTALGGLINTAGLVHIGNPETAAVPHYNFPARPTERYGVHDRVALTPGELISTEERWEGDECHIELKGRVTQAQTYGENLVLTRTYRTRLGESRFSIRDEVINAGYLPTEHMLLYHINVGYPFVDQDSELIAPTDGPPTLLFGDADLSDESSYLRFIDPQQNWVQQTFQHKMTADEDGYVTAAVVNRSIGADGLAMYVRYKADTLPHFIEWRMMAEGQFVVGIEPCTNGFGREQVREAGELIVLQPGDRRIYEVEIGVIDGAAALDAMTAGAVADSALDL